MTSHLVPALHDLAVSVAAPAIVLVRPRRPDTTGAERPAGSSTTSGSSTSSPVSVDGSDLELVRSAVRGRRPAGVHLCRAPARRLAARPHGHARRRRTLTAATSRQEISVTSRAQEAFDLWCCGSTSWATWRRWPRCARASRRRATPWCGADRARAVGRRVRARSRLAFDPARDELADGRRLVWNARSTPARASRESSVLEARGRRSSVPAGSRRSTPAWSPRPTAVTAGRAERRRPGRAADARRRRRVPGGGQPVVPDAVRP